MVRLAIALVVGGCAGGTGAAGADGRADGPVRDADEGEAEAEAEGDAGSTACSAPDIYLSRSSLDFGSPLLGTKSCRTVEVGNVGDCDLEIASVTIDGACAGQYVVESLAVTIPPDATLDLTVCLVPASGDCAAGTLSIASNDPDESTATVDLSSASGGDPALCCTGCGDPPAVDFGTGPFAASLALWNCGDCPGDGCCPSPPALTVTDVYLDGDPAWMSLFTLTLEADGAPASLPLDLPCDSAGAMLDVAIEMDPSVQGCFSVDLVVDTDLAPATMVVPVVGTVYDCEGYADLDGDPCNGCEYTCPVWPPASWDDCNGVDDDCDAMVDEDCGGG